MIEVSNVQAEVTPLDVEVTASNNVEINTIEDDLDVTITKKEYKIVGDEVYIAKLYDDAPQWMKDLVQLVVNNTVEQSNIQLLNNVVEQLNQFATSYVPLNTYTQQILDLSNADASMHTLIETINSNFNNGLDEANAQILGLENTKASKDEVIAQVLTTISAQLATPSSDLGAMVASLQQAIVTGDSANASSIDVLMSSLEGEVDARATAVEYLNTYVGIDNSGTATGTGLLANVEILQKQADGVINTYSNTYDVMLGIEDPNNNTDNDQLVTTAEPYASWLAEDTLNGNENVRLAHIGDVYIKYSNTTAGAKEYIASYKFIKTAVDSTSPYATDADGFTWALIIDQAAQDAYQQALNAYDLADGKRRVFVGLGATSIPSVPYDQGDLWLIDAARVVNGYSCKVGDILRCIETKGEIGTYEQNDWVLASSYANAVDAQNQQFQNFVNTTYAGFAANIQSQVDKKAETFYQNSVPIGRIKSINVSDNATLNTYVGDLWKNTYVGTISGYLGDNTEYIYAKIANGSNWNYDWVKMEVPDIVYDTIDTKKSIYSGNTVPVAVSPDAIETNDMWITGDNPTSPYLPKSIYIWNGVSWVVPVRYTDDQYAKDIENGTRQIDLSEHINSLGWTDDSTIDNFLTVTYAADKLNIQEQIDGKADTYYQDNEPYSLSSLSEAEKLARDGDVWYDTSPTVGTEAYRFNSVGGWVKIEDTQTLQALSNAATAQATADGKIQNFTSQPSAPYYVGDTWMQGATGDIYVCKTERLAGAFSQADWVIASRYTDDTQVVALQTGLANGTTTIKLTNAYVGSVPLTTYLSSEIDGKIGVYSGETAPVNGQPSGVSANDIYLWFTTASKLLANGTTQVYDITRTYKYSGSVWNEITTDSNIVALADLADGKRTVFSGATVPVGAVERDIWIPSANNASYVKGEVYQYIGAVWVVATKYTADLEAVRTNLQGQLDSKVDTYYQATVPTGMTALNNGDYWYCTADVSTYKKGKVYKYVHSTTSWVETADVSRYAFDTADGKASIYTSAALPNVYKTNDLLIIHADNAVGTYSAGVVLTATANRSTGSFLASEWTKKINDTEDLDAFVSTTYTPTVTGLQNQVDSKIESWYTASTSDPKAAWTDAATRIKHDGDLWYQTDTKLSYWYSSATNTWNLIDDAKAIQALADAATAQATADNKISSYYVATLADVQTISSGWTAAEKSNNVGDLAVVWNDSTLDNNGTWRWSGTSWVNTRDKKLISLASAVTALTTELSNGTNTWAAADSQVTNSLTTKIENDVASVESKWEYNSVVGINGVYKRSGFGLTTNYSGGSGTEVDPYVSEFWIDATKLKFTNSAATGRTAPFTIDASGATPQITFNGKVSFSNVTDVPQLGSTPQEVVTAINAGNTTTINGGRITTGSITANQIAANTITANQIAANTITADRFTSTTGQSSVWTGGGLVSQNFNGNVVGSIGNPTQGFRLSSNAAGTSSDPNIYGAYIKGATLEGTTMSTTDIRVTADGYPSNYGPVLLLEVYSGNSSLTSSIFRSRSYLSGYNNKRMCSTSQVFVLQASTIGGFSLYGTVTTTCNIYISINGGSWVLLASGSGILGIATCSITYTVDSSNDVQFMSTHSSNAVQSSSFSIQSINGQ